MTRIFLILILTTLYLNIFGQNSDRLYIIKENNLYGYIDKTGKTIIKPKFFSVGQFSEGLAPVRLNGTYGYIDTKGKFIISPKFDLALSFHNGIAKVFIDGKPYFIDKQGNIIFDHNYKNFSEFINNSFAIVVTQTGKFGTINKTGNLVIDTVYKRINAFTKGVAVVTGLNHNPFPKDSNEKAISEMGVIDTLGNWIVKYGKYMHINDYVNGYAGVKFIVDRQKEFNYNEGVIDETGKYIFTIPLKKWHFDYISNNFYQNIAIVDIYSVDNDTVRSWSTKNQFKYKGAINTNGEIIFSNTDWDELTPFSFNRAFAKTKKGKWFLIDNKGQYVISLPFDKIFYDPYRERPEYLFQNGIAFVNTEKGWGAIDTTGKYVIEPTNFKNVEYNHLIRRGNIIFLEDDISVENDKYAYRYGFWNTENNTIVKPQFHDIDMNGFNNELIYVMQDEKIGYINANGKLIWKEQTKAGRKQLNIDYMNRGYYYASSEYKKELAGLGGWGGSDNNSKQISSDVNFAPNTLQVVIDIKQKTKWAEKYDAIKLFVANTSSDTLYFDAQNSRLYLKIQAQDKNGEWKDIEYLPNSWCGNSYHSLFLAPNEQWEFATPVYQGEFKTKIRAELLYKKSIDQEVDYIIYSNEVDGYINPGQFWNKLEYYPSGIMDPYND